MNKNKTRRNFIKKNLIVLFSLSFLNFNLFSNKLRKKLKKRKNFNQKLLKKFKEIQLPTSYKKKKSKFIIKNNFTKKSVREGIKNILKEIV